MSEHITLEKIMIRGLSNSIKSWFKLPEDPMFYSSTDIWLQLNEKSKQNNTQLNYPQLLFKLVSMELALDRGYSPKALLRHGTYGALDDSNSYRRKLLPLPVEMSFEVMFISDDRKDIHTFASNWLYAAVLKSLNMNVTFDSAPFSIQVDLDNTINLPDKEMTADSVNFYQLTSNITVKAYLTPDRELSEYPKVFMIKQLNVVPNLVTFVTYSYSSTETLEEALVSGDAVAEQIWTDATQTSYEKIEITITPANMTAAQII